MKFEIVDKDPQVIEKAKQRHGKWLDLLDNLSLDKMVQITDSGTPARVQRNLLGSLRYSRRGKRKLDYIVHTLIQGDVLYVWKEPLKEE